MAAEKKSERKSYGVTKTIYLSDPQAKQIEELGVTLAEVVRAGLAALGPGTVPQKVTITLYPDNSYTKTGDLS